MLTLWISHVIYHIYLFIFDVIFNILWGWFLSVSWWAMSTNNHPRKHWRAMGRHWQQNSKDQIAHGNGRNKFSGRVPITPMLKICLLFALHRADLAKLNYRAGITSLHQHHAPLSPCWALAAVLVKPKLWRCQSVCQTNSFCTFMRNLNIRSQSRNRPHKVSYTRQARFNSQRRQLENWANEHRVWADEECTRLANEENLS